MNNYSRTIKFHDGEDMICKYELEITMRNGYPEFTMSGERTNSMGQASFVPKGEWQEKLNTIWDQYHLNGMSAGLPIQQEAITKFKADGWKYDYIDACEKLKELDLYSIPLKDNLPEGFFVTGIEKESIKDSHLYTYGHAWIHCVLPKDFEDTLNEVCDKIEAEEKERLSGQGRVFWSNIEDKKIIALGKHLDLTPNEAREDITNNEDCNYDYSGTSYLVCTNEEADDLWDKELDYYLEECVLSEIKDKSLKMYFDENAWKKDAKQDGRGHSLNRYDGSEDEEDVNGTTYYIYRQ